MADTKIKQQIEQDIKAAMLAGDKFRVTTLRGLKSSILNVEVAEGSRDSGLSDDKVISLFSKESKKRQEAADLYKQAGNDDKAQQELDEKQIIAEYLPQQLSDSDLEKVVKEVMTQNSITDIKQMGQLIGLVKAKTGGTADGAAIARVVKEQLSK